MQNAEIALPGINTYNEKPLHAMLKSYFEPDASAHEIRVGAYIADIVGEDGIIEIQTAGLHKLRSKLEAFLEVAVVTVVHPVARSKWLVWLDSDSDTPRRRKSPKTGTFYEALPELYQIRALLAHPNLRISIVLVDVEERRRKSTASRKGYIREERVPLSIADRLDLRCAADWAAMVPPSLPAPFTSQDYAKAARLSPGKARQALLVLTQMGAVARCGKQRNSILYTHKENTT